MKTNKCKICSMNRRKSLVFFRNILMCQQCAHEYIAIFDGIPEKSSRFYDSVEKVLDLAPSKMAAPLPPDIEEYFNHLLFGKDKNDN